MRVRSTRNLLQIKSYLYLTKTPSLHTIGDPIQSEPSYLPTAKTITSLYSGAIRALASHSTGSQESSNPREAMTSREKRRSVSFRKHFVRSTINNKVKVFGHKPTKLVENGLISPTSLQQSIFSSNQALSYDKSFPQNIPIQRPSVIQNFQSFPCKCNSEAILTFHRSKSR